MEQQLDPKKLILKTKQYEFSDGLRDIQLGITMLIIGWVWYGFMFSSEFIQIMIDLRKNSGELAVTLYFGGVALLPMIITYLMLPVMSYIRRRWLWRESGMISLNNIVVPKTITLISGAIFFIVLFLGYILETALKTGELYMWSILLIGAGWGFGYTLFGLGRHLVLPRYQAVGILGSLASLTLLLYQSSLTTPGLIFTSIWGVLLLISGLVVLRQSWPTTKGESHV